jgi:hypothetical protein
MNHIEYYLHTMIWWSLPIVALAIGAIIHFVDPTGEVRKRRLYGPPPDSFR